VKDTGKDFQPVKAFKPADTFGVLVQLSEALEGTEVTGVWTAVDAGEMHDKKILEKQVEFTAESIKNAKNPSRLDFTLTHDDPYPAGDYKFDVYLNGKLVDTVKFRVEE
jgi:outer membrane usher protein FimD/PapC